MNSRTVGSSPRSTRLSMSACTVVAFSVAPSTRPSGCLSPFASTPIAATRSTADGVLPTRQYALDPVEPANPGALDLDLATVKADLALGPPPAVRLASLTPLVTLATGRCRIRGIAGSEGDDREVTLAAACPSPNRRREGGGTSAGHAEVRQGENRGAGGLQSRQSPPSRSPERNSRARRWLRPRLKGESTLARFADDAIIAFDNIVDAKRVLAVLGKRLARFGLTLHPDKTRLVDFRPQMTERARHPETDGTNFDFLGLTPV